MERITIEDLRNMQGVKGFILQGCGGDLEEWFQGINELLTEQGILLNGDTIKEHSVFNYMGRPNILFHIDIVKLDMEKLKAWRLQTNGQLGSMWLPDYLSNMRQSTTEYGVPDIVHGQEMS